MTFFFYIVLVLLCWLLVFTSSTCLGVLTKKVKDNVTFSLAELDSTEITVRTTGKELEFFKNRGAPNIETDNQENEDIDADEEEG